MKNKKVKKLKILNNPITEMQYNKLKMSTQNHKEEKKRRRKKEKKKKTQNYKVSIIQNTI